MTGSGQFREFTPRSWRSACSIHVHVLDRFGSVVFGGACAAALLAIDLIAAASDRSDAERELVNSGPGELSE